jgi:PPOX class probable F420-dependent enzyme
VAYDAMSREEWLAFLTSPVRPGLLATTRADGRPHIAPIWYALDGETLVFNTGADTVKGRNLRRDGRASICVQDDQPPFSFVTISGHSRISDDLDEVREWAGVIGGRYMGADRSDELAERNGVPGELVVFLRPDHIVAYRDVSD